MNKLLKKPITLNINVVHKIALRAVAVALGYGPRGPGFESWSRLGKYTGQGLENHRLKMTTTVDGTISPI